MAQGIHAEIALPVKNEEALRAVDDMIGVIHIGHHQSLRGAGGQKVRKI